MSKPRLLDLFCGAGGAARGYMDAGFHVTGVDVVNQPRYPFDFVQADALEFLRIADLTPFSFIAASPPCQAFSRAGKLREAQGGRASSGDLLTPTLALLANVSIPWVAENVPGAPLEGVTLCGSMFGLPVQRHRVFASNVLLTAPGPCQHGTFPVDPDSGKPRPIGVYHVIGDSIPSGGKTAETLEEAREAMGIDWMEWNELKEAVPPAYTRWIGERLLDQLLVPASSLSDQEEPA